MQQGSEKRSSILPTVSPSGIGAFGSSYNPGDAMMRPDQLGIKVGDSMDDVVNAVKGVGFYVDQMAFGAPSTGLTSGMPLEPLGINYFVNTGQTCSNGATMWQYIEGIPDGSALGENVKTAMTNMGLPTLRGLAPGMLEDVQHALNPAPLMRALFGSGYPQCRQVTKPVGDAYGRIKDPTTGNAWITDADDLNITVPSNRGGFEQTRWVQDTDDAKNPITLSKDNFDAAVKSYNPDGSPKDGFRTMEKMLTRPATIAVVGVLCLIAFGVMRRRR